MKAGLQRVVFSPQYPCGCADSWRKVIWLIVVVALCLCATMGLSEAAPIVLVGPAGDAELDSCAYYSPTVFEWQTSEVFSRMELQLFVAGATKAVRVKIPDPGQSSVAVTSSVWKKVMKLTGAPGGVCQWKIVGTRADKSIEQSESRAIVIVAPRPVENPAISSTDWMPPTVSWDRNCCASFCVWFGADANFVQGRGFKFKALATGSPTEQCVWNLTEKDWASVRALVGNQSGQTLYWRIEAWDAFKRRSVTTTMSFPLDFATDNLPASKLLDVPMRVSVPGFCYLESFAQQIAHVDNTISVEEVFACSGMGAAVQFSSWSRGFNCFPGRDWTLPVHVRAIRNLGAHYVVGHDVNGNAGGAEEDAVAEFTFSGAAAALQYLKALLHTERCVQVHVDLAYLPSFPGGGAPIQPGTGSHFLPVTGYDADHIYVNGTILSWDEPDLHKNVALPVNEFLLAWQKAGDMPGGLDGPVGPYWMLVLVETDASQLTRTPLAEILQMQKDFSDGNVSVIQGNLDSDFSQTSWGQFYTIKRVFADFLDAQGYTAAAGAYRDLADAWWVCGELSVTEQRTRLGTIIAPAEAQARTLY